MNVFGDMFVALNQEKYLLITSNITILTCCPLGLLVRKVQIYEK